METSRANEAPSSSSAIPPKFKYDVFLSFSGQDTRNNFTNYLLAALDQYGFHTFRDDTKLTQGENIGHELMKAIEESRVSLVVLSTNYFTSKWCLDELVKIMECRKSLQHTVLPIFYYVEPSDVRTQKGSLAEAFNKHEGCLKEGSGVKVEKWRKALTEVANLSGWDVLKVANGDEACLIRKVIEVVQNELDLEYSNVACHEIGLDSRLQNLQRLLYMESDCVRIVAIWGMGGIGKTTISKKLYTHIHHDFESSCFLENIRETWKQPNGQAGLLEQLLSDILRSGTLNFRNRHQQIRVLIQRAFCRKVLLILDDVDDVEQLKALAIDRGYFGFGSRIIITTRDISSLNLLKVDEIYAVEKLNMDESLKLFRWHCFKEEHLTKERLDLSSQVVHYTGGLPLALEVLGSYLHDKSIPEWKSAISKLKKIPHDKIQEKLQISFDSLGREEKKLFLDIACFFLRTNGGGIVKIMEGCQKYAVNGIRDLANRCLVKYDDNQLKMHDLVRGMGREIVRQESPDDLGKRSRLWHIEDVLEVLRDGTGTETVKGLVLSAKGVKLNEQPFHRLRCHKNALMVWRDGMESEAVNAKAFEKMNNLWLLHLDYIHVTGGYEHISKRLLWLSWKGFPLQYIPQNFSMEKLVALDLCYSNLNKVWNENKVLNNLKFLYLSHCHYLTRTPDFCGLKSLEELLLNDCKSLMELDESIVCLNKLVILDMRNCIKLRKLPSSIWTLKSLKSFDLSGCSMLGRYFGYEGSPLESMFSFFSSLIFRTKRMDSIGLSLFHVSGSSWLKDLRMANSNLSCLPNEVENLISLENLDLSWNNLRTIPDSICNLTRLKNLELSCGKLTHLPGRIGMLSSLEYLGLGENNLLTLPDSICDLTRLKDLELFCCKLTHLPGRIGMLSSLEYLGLEKNFSLTLPDSICNLVCLKKLDLNGCNLSHLPDRIGMLSSLTKLDLERNDLLMLPDSICNLACLTNLVLDNCNLSYLPNQIGMLSSLTTLDLRGTDLLTLPDSICNLDCLTSINLLGCKLSRLPDRIGMLTSLEYLCLGRDNICTLPDRCNDLAILEFYLSGSPRLHSRPPWHPVPIVNVVAEHYLTLGSRPTEYIERLAQDGFGTCLQFQRCNDIANEVMGISGPSDEKNKVFSEDSKLKIGRLEWYLRGDEVPNCFEYKCTGPIFSLEVPPLQTWRIQGCFLCIVFRTDENCGCFPIAIHCKSSVESFPLSISPEDQDQMLLLRSDFLRTHLYGGDRLKIKIKPLSGWRGNLPWTVKKWGVNLIHEDDGDSREIPR